MAGPYIDIQAPVQGQPISSSMYGIPVKAAIDDLHSRAVTLEQSTQAIVARARRITSKSVVAGSAGTEFGFVRLDNIPVKAGYGYRIMTTPINIDTDTVNDGVSCKWRVAFSASPGTFATTSSTQYGQVRNIQFNIAVSVMIPLSGFYFADTDGFISIIITGQRVAGSGALVFFAAANEVFDLTVEFAGPTPLDTGVSL